LTKDAPTLCRSAWPSVEHATTLHNQYAVGRQHLHRFGGNPDSYNIVVPTSAEPSAVSRVPARTPLFPIQRP
jgi:hypothetical protein